MSTTIEKETLVRERLNNMGWGEIRTVMETQFKAGSGEGLGGFFRAVMNAAGLNSFDETRDERTKGGKSGIAEFLAGHEQISRDHFAAAIANGPDVWAAHFGVGASTPVSEPAPAPAPAPKASPNDALAALKDALGVGQIDEAAVKRIVAREIESIDTGARRIDVSTIDGGPVVSLDEAPHPDFEKVLRLAKAGANVMLVGPAGSGKSTLARHVAKALDRSYGDVSLSAGVSESELLGYMLPTGEGGRFEYHPSDFVERYEGGGVFLFDEIDAADPNMLIVTNSATANGGFTNPIRWQNRRVARHADTVLMAAANTYGTGADMQYVGRAQLDAATLDRWYVVAMDYDPRLEASICGVTPEKIAVREFVERDEAQVTGDAARLHSTVMDWRKRAAAAGLQRVISTRALQKGVIGIRAGLLFEEIKSDLLAGWQSDERRAIGEAA